MKEVERQSGGGGEEMREERRGGGERRVKGGGKERRRFQTIPDVPAGGTSASLCLTEHQLRSSKVLLLLSGLV